MRKVRTQEPRSRRSRKGKGKGKRNSKPKQQVFDFAVPPSKRVSKNGVKLGRPRKERAGVAHVRRGMLDARHPLHVTLRVAQGLASLRGEAPSRVIRECFVAASGVHGLRVLEFTIQSNHLHLIVEIDGEHAETRNVGRRRVHDVRKALGLALRGLSVRIARGLNKLWGRRGAVFPERYHVEELDSVERVRRARAYALENWRKHGAQGGTTYGPGPDPRATGRWSSVWYAERWGRALDPALLAGLGPRASWPIVPPSTWLAREAYGLNAPRGKRTNPHPMLPFEIQA